MTFETTKSAGDEVDSRCLKCKAITNHTIIALTGSTIAKVECNSCRGRHNYRPPVTEKKKKPTIMRRRDGITTVSKTDTAKTPNSRAAGAKKKTSKELVNFDILLKNKDAGDAITYSIDATLTQGDLVNHSTFGLGVVTAIMPPNKAQVTFQKDGPKLLACRL